MHADLDLLLSTVYVTADALLPESNTNAARRVTGAEVVTLCVAQAIMWIRSDRRFLAVGGKHLAHLFRELPKRPGYFKLWGFRLHAIFAPDGTPRALALRSPKADEREIGLTLPDRCQRRGGEVLLGERDATFMRAGRKQERGTRPHLAPIRQRIESIFWTCKDLLTLARFCCLAAASTPNHQLARTSRALVNHTA
jgi:hypothetical protein